MSIRIFLLGSVLIASVWTVAAFTEDAGAPAKSDQENAAKDADTPDTAKATPPPSPGTTQKATANTPPGDKPTPLNTGLRPNQSDDMIPSVYKDMVVVQRKAKQKGGHFLFAPSVDLDFSDGPITSYAINTDVGYALSDFWEVYANIVPTFITIERPIVNKVRQLDTINGPASITYAKPISQFGGEILWAPAYGKESWGPYSIVRSDTFFKMGLSEVNFAGGSNGLRYSLLVGKTYFISRWINIRAQAGIAYMNSIVDGQKTGDWAPVIDLGLVYYF
jgi:hypothetical protein